MVKPQVRLVDVSHTVEDGLVTYRGLPAPVISEYLNREDSRRLYSGGTEFHIGKIEMVANTGTYLDSQYHRFADGTDLAGLPLEKLANLNGIVLRCLDQVERSINLASDELPDVRDSAVLFHTDWSRYWNTPQYFEGYPYLTADMADLLRKAGVALVGIDSLNIDNSEDGRRPVHTALLEAGIPIVEHLTNLGQLPETGFRFFAVPVKVKGLGSFPVRAFGVVDTG